MRNCSGIKYFLLEEEKKYLLNNNANFLESHKKAVCVSSVLFSLVFLADV